MEYVRLREAFEDEKSFGRCSQSEGGGETKRSDLLNAVEEKQSVKNQPVNQ